MNPNLNSPRAVWPDAAIFTFIQIIEEVKSSKQDCTGYRKNSLYDKVALLMQQKGYNYQICQLRNKWKKLTETYRSIINGTAKKLDRGFYWPFFEAMHQVHSNLPTLSTSFCKEPSVHTLSKLRKPRLLAPKKQNASFDSESNSSQSAMSDGSDAAAEDGPLSMAKASDVGELMKIFMGKTSDDNPLDGISSFVDSRSSVLEGSNQEVKNQSNNKRPLDYTSPDSEDRIIKFLKKEKQKDREMLADQFSQLRQALSDHTDRIVSAIYRSSNVKDE